LFNAFDATGYTVNKSPDVIVNGGGGSWIWTLRAAWNHQHVPEQDLPLQRGWNDREG